MEHTISKKKLFRLIKKEYELGRRWVRRNGFGYYYTMMIDVDTAEVWSDVHMPNSWNEYHDDSIKSLHFNAEPLTETVPQREQGYLDTAIEYLTEAGWTITE